MNYTVEYTYPEQYIIYLNDDDLLKCLKGVISQDSCCVEDADLPKEENITKLATIISKQFRMDFVVALSYVRDTIFKEAAKRWSKIITASKFESDFDKPSFGPRS